MLYLMAIVSAGLFVAVSCHPRSARAAAVANTEVDNYIELPLDQKVKYHYQYGIDDPSSGVLSHKWEERLGSYVKGAYSMMEADGRIRTVDYEVDGPRGFHAVVRTSLPGNSYLSTQQLRKSRVSNPNPPVNVLTNNIPSRPVLEPRTPRLIHKDLPPNFHSVKPDYFWGSAPGGHAAKHRHEQDGGRQGQNGGRQGRNGAGFGETHSSYRTPATEGSSANTFDDTVVDEGFEAKRTVGLKNEGRYVQGQGGRGQNVNHDLRNSNGRHSGEGSSSGRGVNAQTRFAQQRNVQSYERDEEFGNSRQTKGRRQEGEVGNFLGGADDDLSGVMLPPRRNAEVMNYDHLLRAGKITDVLYL